MSFHYNRSPSSQSISITPTYSFEELQDIWNLQKEILNKYKSSQVPFVILDQDNSGVISSKDFPYRLVARGFPCNTALYLKFFSFLDINNDGFINMEDWIEGFKSIGARFVETRCKAREELKAANLIAHSRTSSSIDGYNTTPAKYTQNSFETSSSQKSWATPKNIDSRAILQTPIQLTQYSSEDPMQRINFGFNSQLNNGQGIGRRLSTEPHSIMHNKQEQNLQIDTSGDAHKDAAMRINARVDNILKNIESRKNLFSGATPKMDFMSDIKRTESLVSPTAQFQKMSGGLKNEAQKPEEIHHSIKKSAADTIGAIRTKLGLDPVGKESAVKIIEEKGAYTPSVTSITGTEEDVPTPKVTENLGFGKTGEAKENNLQIKSLKSLLPQRKPSPQESKRSLASQSSASRGEEGNSYLDQVTRAIAAKRKNNSQSIAIPTHSASEKDLETPSWKDSPAFRTGDLEEGAVLEMMEKLLEKYGSHDEALKSLRKEDLLRFPRLRMFVNSLEGQTWFKDKVNRGRQFCNGVRKRSRTKSMIELRVKGDLVKEIEMEVQRRRAITPDISMSHIVYKDTVKADKRPDRIANAEKMIESLKEFAKQSVRAKGKTKSQKVGAELAKEILEGKEPRNGLSVYNRVQEKLRGERKYGEAQRTCQEVREMFGSRKKEVKTEIKKSNNEEALSNFGYSIQLDEFRKNSSSSLLRRESPLNRKENIRGIEDEKRLKLRGVIDQLSHEAASMEASFSRSRTDLRKPLLQEPIDSKQRLLNLMTQKNEVKVEKLLVPEKRRVKSFIRGSISSSHLGSDDFCSTQSSIETQLRDRLSQNRPVNRYSKLANDLGALSVTIDKPERKVSISPIHRTRTSKNSSISVSSLLKEEYLGRGKSFLQSDYTGMSSLLKEFSTPATTKSTKRIGFNKY